MDADAFERNVATMAAALPGGPRRPHVKADKCTGLAARQAAAGHSAFTCATIREVEGMAAAGLGHDLLLANGVVDAKTAHGLPQIKCAAVLSVSDEHVTFTPDEPVSVGDHIMVWPAHLDPTVAYHERMHLVRKGEILETWRVDLREW